MPSDTRRARGRAGARTAGSGSWPALTYETLAWNGQHDAFAASRTERRKHQGPYKAAIVPKIAEASLELSGELAALVEDASTEIARIKSRFLCNSLPAGSPSFA